MDFIKKEIAQGITLAGVSEERFKTNETAVSLVLPLRAEDAAANALFINLISRRSAAYPTPALLNRRLAHMYGALLYAAVSKVGECQVLKLGISSLDDRFSLDGESISFDCIKLLLSMLFEPNLDENGLLCSDDVEAEKRLLTEKIEAEKNEKRIYVLRKTEEAMFKDEPYGVNRYGTVEQINALTAERVTEAWKNALARARVMITTVGSADADKIAHCVSQAFSSVGRCYTALPRAVFVPECGRVSEYMERMDVKQGKLVLGFRVNLKPDDPLAPAMRSFCDIFGGGPYSKLFANVREKLSLCYYYSAMYTRLKSVIMIQCGCNEENMDKAVSEILAQLEEIKNGNFLEEFNSSKIGLSDTIMSVNDSPDALEAWYSNQLTDCDIKSPEQAAGENNAVTAEQVQSCAALLTLDTVYKLSSPKEAE